MNTHDIVKSVTPMQYSIVSSAVDLELNFVVHLELAPGQTVPDGVSALINVPGFGRTRYVYHMSMSYVV